MTRAELTEKILDHARQEGFSLAGIAIPGQMQGFQKFTQWIDRGFAADMQYLYRADTLVKRENPTLIMPDVKSILIVALPYFDQKTEGIDSPSSGLGRVASYAWGADYHDVLPRKLERLVEKIKPLIQIPFGYKICTDSAPILERELAVNAGLGWIGRSSMLINPNHGSTFLLGELFLTLDLLPTDTIISDHCGNCDRCIKACPTACIQPDRTIDAGKCISYLTIENKSEIPTDLGSMMADWVFGCDICQQVCPWNIRFSSTQADVELRSVGPHRTIDLHKTITADDEELKSTYLQTPLARAKPYGLKRNARNALTNDLLINQDTNRE